jgi:hypothetical protein
MKTPLLVSSSLLGGLVVLLAAAPAKAQDSTPPPAAAPMASPASSGMGGGGIGVGAFVSFFDPGTETFAQFVYDQSNFHLAGDLGFNHVNNNGATSSDFTVAVEGWYHLSKGASADFSVGGLAGLDYNSPMGAGNSSTVFTLEPAAEARLFVTQSFAFTGRFGLAFVFGDNNTPTTITFAQATGAFGFTYFFR